MTGIPDKIKKIITSRDILPKVGCIILAVILWGYISSTNIEEVKFNKVISYKNLSNKLVVSKGWRKYITITLNGRKDILKTVNINNIHASVDLDKPTIGSLGNYPVEVSKQEIPISVDVSFSPKTLPLMIERKISKRIMIKPKVLDDIKDGYIIEEINVVPEYAGISGPESYIKKIGFTETKPISVQNETGTIVREIPIEKNGLNNVDIDISSVSVTLTINESPNLFKIIANIESENVQDQYEYLLKITQTEIYLKSEDDTIEPTEEDVEAYVDMASVDIEQIFKESDEKFIETDFIINIKIKKKDIKLISIKPDTVPIIIRKKEIVKLPKKKLSQQKDQHQKKTTNTKKIISGE